ncbi:MAG: M23 family metallopeptidase [Bacteroidota bacterium]
MNRSLILFSLLGIFLMAFSNETEPAYPQDYFRSPVDRPITLSGTFGELRSNHFHSGIDIKGSRGVGEPLYAIADGFISRIAVKPGGYGNALYIDHPNGYTSVYAHLHKFSKPIAAYIKAQQYKNRNFPLNDFPDRDLFPIKKGEIIGFLGNSGHSFGPHLHFEIRDTQTEEPINPLLFGYEIKDNTPPMIQELRIYHLNDRAATLRTQTFTIRKSGSRHYISKDTLEIESDFVGFGLKTYDQMDGVRNWNGVYTISVLEKDKVAYHFEIERFSFDDKRYINAHTDYGAWRKDKSRFNRTYLLPGNHLPVYETNAQRGMIRVPEGQAIPILIEAADASGNKSSIKTWVKKAKTEIFSEYTYNYHLPEGQENIIMQGDAIVHFPAKAFYEEQFLMFQREEGGSPYSDLFQLGDPDQPIHQGYELKIEPRQLPERYRDKALIAQCYEDGHYESLGGNWDGQYLVAKAWSFGDFCVILDTIPPTVQVLNPKSIMGKGYRLNFKIDDERSGINAYQAQVDGQWILMEYDQKNDRLFHRFDGTIPSGKHQFTLTVTDRRNNQKTYQTTFSN